MFASRFTKKAQGPLNDQEFVINRPYGNTNSRQGRLRSSQDRSQDHSDSINISQRPQPVSRRNSEYQRPGRITNNRKTNFNATKKQPAVRQADSQIYQRSFSKNANNIQPEIIGTNTFQPPPKSQPDTHSPRNLPINHVRRLSNVSEQPSEQSSSFCIINQGNLPKSIGLDDFREPEFSLYSPEPDPGSPIIDYCAFCLNKQKFVPATHYCSNCGLFGRYLCMTCLGQHNNFAEKHSVQSLSGQSFKKQIYETSVMDKYMKETEKSEIQNNRQHQSFIRDVSVKTENDDQSCQITGFCQIRNGTIVLTEMNNKAIKTLDSGSYQVTSTYQLSEYPMDICCMDGNEALVILYKSTIQYISIDPDDHIQLTRKKVLNHDCICLAYCNRKIYVGSSKSLYIYDTNWVETDKITNELFGDERIFSDRFSISVSELDNITTIYVADENNGMCSFEIMGQDITTTWKFKDCNTFKAVGMCFDSSRNVLLCDKGSERLIKMNQEGMILSILLDSSCEIQPLNIPFHDKKNNNVLISLSGKDFIKVFNFK